MKVLKSTLSIILTSALLVGTGTMANGASSSVNNDATKEEDYLILTDSSKALDKAKELSNSYNNLLKTENSTLTVSSVELSKADAAELQNTDGVISVEKDITLSGSATEESGEDTTDDVLSYLFQDVKSEDINQWYLDAVGTDNVKNGDKVKVELLDSGVNYSEDIDVKYRVNLIPDNNFNVLYEDFSGHGTSMASVISAKDNGKGLTGINPNAELYSVKVLDDEIKAPLSRIVEGIRWGIDNDMDIINMSFGTSVNSLILKTAIEEADEAGILLVSATGNNSEKGVQYPAAYPQVLAVGSMDENSSISEFTSTGDEMDVIAPGEKIETTGIFGTIQSTEGTSIATAQVSALASKILAKDNTKSPDFVKKLIKTSAKKVQDNGVITGAVDGDYALEIYDEFASTYSPNSDVTEYTNADYNLVYDTESFVEGLWSKAQHIELAEIAYEYYDSKDKDPNYLKLIVAGARAADVTVDNYDFTKIAALHGAGNYVANLKVAWNFLHWLENGKTVNYAAKQASSVIDSMKKSTEGNKFGISDNTAKICKDLLDCFSNLVNVDFSKYSAFNATDKKGNVRFAKYKSIGLCIHMIGDTFAHRTQVPVVYSGKNSKNKYYFNCTETVDNKSEHLFNTKTVKFTTNTDKQNILDTAQETDFLANTPSMRSINHLRKAVSLGVVEFRDIKKYSYRYFNNEKGPICHAYEDNPNFYTRRYDEAMYACDAFMISGFDDQFYYTDLAPTENENGTFVKLWEFKRYAYESHCDLSDLPKNDWNKNTSIPKIVDDNGNIVYKYSKEKY